MLDRVLSACVDRAIAQLPRTCRDVPATADALVGWTTRLSPTGRARDYFEGGRAIMFLLPWWLEKRIQSTPSVPFQELLVESTVNAYYFVRIIDNVMDENAATERDVLPLLCIFHANFSRAYARLFPPDAPFWDHFDRYWSLTANAAIREKQLSQLSTSDFVEISARKTSGIKIPLAAVCCHYDRLDLLEPWCAFYDRFACWQQMMDDTFDWTHDLRHGNVTFFLSEGHRQKRRGESVSGWVVRRGFAWSSDWLAAAMRDLRSDAAGLESPELVRFLSTRDAEFREYADELRRNLKKVAMVADAFEPIDEEPVNEENVQQ